MIAFEKEFMKQYKDDENIGHCNAKEEDSSSPRAPEMKSTSKLYRSVAFFRRELHSSPFTESYHVSGNTKHIDVLANKTLLLKSGSKKFDWQFQTSQSNQKNEPTTTQAASASQPSIRPADIDSSPDKNAKKNL